MISYNHWNAAAAPVTTDNFQFLPDLAWFQDAVWPANQ